MSCRKCKRDTPPDALYCPYCGTSLNPTPKSHKPRTRPNGAGTAIKRGKTWTARVVVAYKLSNGDNPHAQAIYRTKGGFKTKREALDYCVTLKSKDYKPKGDAPQLIDYWTTYEKGEFEKLSKDKKTGYRGAWKKLKDIHYRPVDQLTVAEIRDCVSKSASTYYTVKDCKTVLTKLFELAGADGWCSKDIPSYIVLPKLKEKERVPFTEEEQASLWRVYESGDIRAAVPLVMIYTGAMPGEMQQLKVENIDLVNHKILDSGMKTEVRKKSAIYIPDDIIPVLEDLIANAKPNGYLWPKNEKKWYADYYDVLKVAGCRKLEPYSCRHTTATKLAIDKLIAPQTTKRIMRWSTTKMLDRYVHPDEADIFNAVNKIGRESTEDNQ